MSDTDIDYQSLYEGVCGELEQARLTILKMRYARTLSIDTDAIRDFLTRNYIVIGALSSLIVILLCFVDVFYKIRRTRER